jgi:tetratricopeptide (TPR) repeat protein
MKHGLKQIIIILALLIFTGKMSAQDFSVDTLRNDSLKAIEYYRKAKIERNKKNYDKAIFLAEKSLKIAVNQDFERIEAQNFILLAKINSIQGDLQNTIRYYIKAANIYEQSEKKEKLTDLYKKTGDNYYIIKGFEKAGEYYQQALNLSKDSGKSYRAGILEDLGYTHFKTGDYSESLNYFLQLIDVTESKTDLVRAYYNIAEVYEKQEKYDKTYEYNKKIYQIYAKANDSISMAIVQNNMGYNQVLLKNYNLAIDHFRESLEILRQTGTDKKEMANHLTNIGICYQNLQNYDQAINYLRKALKLIKTTDDYSEKARIENILALIYKTKEDLYNAVSFSRESVNSAEQGDDKQILQLCYKTYSELLKEGNDYIKALEYYEKHLQLKDSLRLEKRLAEQQLARKRYDLEKSEKQLQLSIADEEMKDLIVKKLRLEAEKREQKIELLKRDKELQQSEKERIMQSMALAKERHEAQLRKKEITALEREKELEEARRKEKEQEVALLESEKEKQQLKIEKQNEARKRTQWVLILLSVIVILILIGFITVRKKNSVLARQKNEIEEKNEDLEQKNEEITTQKELIEEKNESITASIQYAKKIQSAVLPPENYIQSFFPESFVYFKPRDIVSGDFYWIQERDGHVFIIAADCTGHGVPGAFMSMLGTEFLDKAISSYQEINAGKILDELRKDVIHALKQRGKSDEAKDGMDMAMCIVSPDKKSMQFAGANNPLYFIENKTLSVIKGDRMPIGIHMRADQPFTNHHLQIQNGTNFYIFSDGFADQFGGPKKKKYKYKPFKEFLTRIHEKPFNEQKKLLDKEFIEWKANINQVDDVLVIGFKVE